MSDSTVRLLEEQIENEWLGLGDVTRIRTVNPFDLRPFDQTPLAHLLSLCRRPEYFGFACRHLLGKTLHPFQLALLRELWTRPFPMLIGTRGCGKSFLLALYAILRALFDQGSKIIVVGAGFRQAKVIFEYCEEIWANAPVLRDVCSDSTHNGPRRDIDRCHFRIGESIIIFLPMGDGGKIRGQRANVIIADEFSVLPLEVFENVVLGFAAVSMSPIEKVRHEARLRAMLRLGLRRADDAPTSSGLRSNQTIVSGTAYYSFNHFYSYWKKWKAIVESRGEKGKLEEIFQGEVPENFDWRDYCVIRLPVEMLPAGFMDSKHVSKARATIHATQFGMEYAACFANDSNGFFRRSLVESCVVGKMDAPIRQPSCGEVHFTASLRGLPERRHVMAVDPASERDNFSVVVLELWPEHRRIVHCWTTNRLRYKAKLKKGLVKEQDYYGYAARKIRDLMALYPCERLLLDSQGGGVAVMEALGDSTALREGERPIYHVVEEEKERDTDYLAGDHVLEMVNFARAEWVSEANHGLRKDLEDRALLFPEFDPAVVGLAIEEDRLLGRVDEDEKLYDTLEDCVMEIEELKDELASIVHTQTGPTLRDRWDTPEVKQPGGKKGRQRKDRYSALLMANMAARVLQRTPSRPEYQFMGGFAADVASQAAAAAAGRRRSDRRNPEWYEKATRGDGFGACVHRGVV